MEIKTDEITSLLKQQLSEFKVDIDVSEVGEVIMVGDGVAHISGLKNVMSSELVELPNGVFGMALNLEEDNVGLVLFGESRLVREGDLAKRTGRVVEVPVGHEMLGRVVNPLGQPIDGNGKGAGRRRRLRPAQPGCRRGLLHRGQPGPSFDHHQRFPAPDCPARDDGP